MNNFVIAALAVIVLIGGWFLYQGTQPAKTDVATSTPEVSESVVRLSSSLDVLAEGTYEAWLLVGDEKISAGTFNAEQHEFIVPAELDLAAVSGIAVTIEPADDVDPGPSAVVVLEGDLFEGRAELAFPVDFTTASGSVILATPSDGEDTNETSGIWFLKIVDGVPAVSLSLPELPTGWVYEGWAVHADTPITSGRFTDVAAADDFNGYSGPEATPPFPGEDFLVNAPDGLEFPIDLADGSSAIVISVEPDIDGVDPAGDSPAQPKPLVVVVDAEQLDHESISFNQNVATVPHGNVVVETR